MAPSVALVQGASRGLGLAFCRALLSGGAGLVFAGCRDPTSAPHLEVLRQEYPERLSVLRLDVTQEENVKQAVKVMSSGFGKLDLVINAAGILHPSGRGETCLKDVSPEGLASTWSTNTIGPLLVAKHCSPLLLKGTGAFGYQFSDQSKQHSAILVNITAKVGSIGDNALGGWYSYRMSKAALNMATKNLSLELGRGNRKVVCVSLHPGTVDTDLSRPYHRNIPTEKLFTPEHSVNCLMKIIENLSLEKTGKFISWDGTELPW
ncbi:C-signal-like isoform X2 [Ambystoma mexicanum]|uniref:C-signal-like isoform X2 n=1 Tax=Ambystoma mexicanum TaxID=8296 RepID=UPI0037E7EA5E